MSEPLPPPGRARELALKERRRAEALRDNLRRRKNQLRAREAIADEMADQPPEPNQDEA